jgi:GT2 family glycosyltransferase
MTTPRVGIVVIGRNEGDRLITALRSAARVGYPVVYVDSGSTDGSPERARQLVDAVIELNPDLAFTAARGRNEGHAFLRSRYPELEFVQFLDGDTELSPSWIVHAITALQADRTIAAVAGRLDEVDGDSSKYARLLRMEWVTPPGDARSCGGIAAFRSSALEEVGGFSADLAAGEEPELCARLRKAGYRIVISREFMGTHRGNIEGFADWWRRAVRAGDAALECVVRGGRDWAADGWRQTRSALIWGAAMPLGAAAGLMWLIAVGNGSAALAVLFVAIGLYALQWQRVRRSIRRAGQPDRDARLYATYCLIGKPAACLGVIRALARGGAAPRRSLHRDSETLGARKRTGEQPP